MKQLRSIISSLNRGPQLSFAQAGFFIFVAMYLAAAVTILSSYELLVSSLTALGLVFLAVALFMTIVFGISVVVKRTDIVDIAWGGVFVVAGVSAWILAETPSSIGFNVQTLTMILVLVWALRLIGTIFYRVKRRSEDARYIELRRKWKGSVYVNTYLRVFLTQAAIGTAMSVALVCIMLSPERSIGVVAWIGAAVWLVGFLFEAIGDEQLRRFMMNPVNKSKLMTKGVWSYTRHPNYFGETAQWWGIFVIGLSLPFGILGIITPVIITYLLLFVSGVPMTEKALSKKRGWKQYAERVSIFLPLPPKQ